MSETKDRPMNITDQVIAIIAEQALLDPEDVTLDSTLESLGIDSMGVVESIFAIEEAFDITVPFNANNPTESDFDITSVASIIKGIERLKAEQA
jgi:acyl carrier protein